MKKRTAPWTIATLALLAACSSPAISSQIGLQAQIGSGHALNSGSGHYRAGAADIALTKIVSLPNDQLGLRFLVTAPSLSGRCCGLFPRMALVGLSSTPAEGGTYEIDVAEDRMSVTSDGQIPMSLFGGRPERRLGGFTVDLAALGVST